MRYKIGFIYIAVWVLSVGLTARADEVFFQDDFGTDTQVNNWTITASNGYTLSSPGWAPDLDGDGLCRTLLANTGSTVTITRRIDAPAGRAFRYPKLDGYTFCDPSRNSTASWAVSRDGVTWDFLTVGGRGTTVHIDTAGDPRYAFVTRIWIRGQAFRGDFTAGLQNAKLYGETVPFALDYSKVGIYAWNGDPCDVAYNKIFGPTSGVISNKLNVDMVYAVRSTLAESIAVLDPILAAMDLSRINVLVMGEENHMNGPVLDGLYHHIKTNYPEAPPVYLWMTPMQSAPDVSISADGYFMDSYGIDGPTFRKWLMKHLVTGKPVLNCVWASPAGDGFGGWDAMHESSQAQVAICKEYNVPVFFFAVDWAVGGGSVNSWFNSSDPAIAVWRDWFYQVLADAHATVPGTLPAASANHSDGERLRIAGNENHAYQYTDSFTDQKFIDRATIDGFLSLRWDYAGGRLLIEPRPGVPNVTNSVTLVYRFYADTSISQIVSAITGSIRGAGTEVELALSNDGTNWVSLVRQAGAAGQTQTVSLTANGGELTAGMFYVRLQGQVPASGDAYIALDHFTVNAHVAPPPPVTLVPDPGGQVLWRDDLESQNYLHLMTITNPSSLFWQPEQHLYINGRAGAANAVTLRQQFTCNEFLKTITATIEYNRANYPNWASWNTIGISLNGSTILVSDSTRNYPANAQGAYTGPITATLPIPEGTKVFYVHYGLYSYSGVAVSKSNIIDNLKVTATLRDTGSLQGTVILDSYGRSPDGVPVTVELRRQSGDNATFHGVLDADGRFTLPTVWPGTYSVWVKASHWLAQHKVGVTVSGAAAAGIFTLVNGDVDGDNVVGFADFAMLQNYYGQAVPENTHGDLNGDGYVTFEDFGILQNAYGAGGSPGPARPAGAPAATEAESEADASRIFGTACLPVGLVLPAGLILAGGRLGGQGCK